MIPGDEVIEMLVVTAAVWFFLGAFTMGLYWGDWWRRMEERRREDERQAERWRL